MMKSRVGAKKRDVLVYQHLVRQLQQLIAGKPYDDGGWLPSAEKLAERFGASRLTCLKALRFMEVEGLVRGFPPRGFYVTPRDMRHRKIAIIYATGETSPFFRQGIVSEETRQNCDMSAAIDYISQHGFFAQMIQASRPDQLASIAGAYGVEGALWFFPHLDDEDAVSELLQSGIPTLLVNPEPTGVWHDGPEIRYDFHSVRKERIRFLLARGHRNILYIGSYNDAKETGVESELLKTGANFGKDHCLIDLFKNGPKLGGLIEKLNITAILSAVSDEENAFLRYALSKIPFEKQPETLIWDAGCAPRLGMSFEPVRTIAMNRRMTSLPGLVAARQLLLHLETGDPLHSELIGYSASTLTRST